MYFVLTLLYKLNRYIFLYMQIETFILCYNLQNHEYHYYFCIKKGRRLKNEQWSSHLKKKKRVKHLNNNKNSL